MLQKWPGFFILFYVRGLCHMTLQFSLMTKKAEAIFTPLDAWTGLMTCWIDLMEDGRSDSVFVLSLGLRQLFMFLLALFHLCHCQENMPRSPYWRGDLCSKAKLLHSSQLRPGSADRQAKSSYKSKSSQYQQIYLNVV